MKSMKTGSEAFVEALRIENTEVIFGIVGSAFMDPLDIFPRGDIRFVQVRHEQSAALMAEGYARMTGRPGVCIGQNGPGITNLVTGVASAALNHTPLVVITPAVTTATMGTKSFQEIDQMRMLAPIVTWQTQVIRADRVSEALRGAFRAAIATRGPVQVDIPRDLYYGKFEEEEQQPHQYRTSGRYGGAPHGEIERAANLLLEAKRPVFLAGLGAVDSDAGAAIAALADRFAAPVGCVWLHNDAFPGSHRLAVGPIGYQGSLAAMRLLSEADVVLALGTRLNLFGTTPQYDFDFFPTNAKLIHNSINPLELGAFRPMEVGLLGDCLAVVNQLLEATEGRRPNVNHETQLRRIDDEKRNWADMVRGNSLVDGEFIHPKRALWEISQAIPKDAAVVCDVGNVSGSANPYFNFDKPRRWFGPGSLGGIGVGFPTALGVKLANPNLPVLALVGDGAWSMALQEVMTAVREKINLVTVIFNNSQYGAERRNQYDFFNERFFWTDLENPNFAAIAGEMGALGMRVDAAGDIAPKIKEAFAAERPVVLEIVIDPKVLSEPYRRDALRTPERIMSRYRN
ncbi:sulfoacetaldehyde acetyltransferase [Acidiphilium sp. AL]|uniref:sulfoacetaldehyde acetyltransferase n=1 Tax=Acidiphilium sp. AL TaxID=2871704 RepID=UPI0021CB1FF8|nr:sulfoacetaldehyde acetyltransferase [Acidiphilium sp. AL]MCU4161987.1 sulfoacetaldehyde acetyltransferase [Acidiphilium sp. AL]